MKRRTTALILAVALALTVCGASVLAAEEERVSQDILNAPRAKLPSPTPARIRKK